MPRIAAPHPLERLARSRIRIREDRRRERGAHVIDRQQIGAVARERIAFGLHDRLNFIGVSLGESGIEKRDDRDIESIEPDDRHVAGISMIVKRPRRRDDEIAGMHRRALAVDGRIRAVAFDDKAQRRLAVPMARRDLTGKNELQSRVERMRDRRRAAQSRILQHEHAPLGFLCRDQRAGFEQMLAHDGIAPQRGHARRSRRLRNEIAQHLP